MKRVLLALAPALLLAGCLGSDDRGNPGVKSIQIPNAPAELIEKAGPLPQIEDPTMGGLVTDGVKSDIQYNDVSFRYNKLIDLYLCVQDSVNNKKDLDKCLNN